jgi:hypothetical protein
MSALTFENANKRADVEIAKALAMSSAVEIKHRYRMSRIEAEQEAIKVRLRRNFWRSRTAKNMHYTLCIAFGLGLGVLAHSQWLLYERESGQAAPAASQAARTPANQTATGVGGRDTTGTASQGAVGAPAEQASPVVAPALAVMDSIDVPFLRAKSSLGKKGLTGILDFVKVNDKAQKIQVTAVHGPTENSALASERALIVVDALMTAGLSRQAVEVMPVVSSPEDGKVISGVRLSSMGPRLRVADSISTGAPLGSSVGVMPLPFNSAFSQGAIVSPVRQPDGPGELASPTVQRPKPATDDEGEANAKELEKAVKLAASRRQLENAQPTAQPKQKPPQAKAVSKPESGLETAQVTGNQDPKPATATKSNAFTIVSKLENAVLIRVGREVRHIQVGDPLPDGTVLGKNLEPISPSP